MVMDGDLEKPGGGYGTNNTNQPYNPNFEHVEEQSSMMDPPPDYGTATSSSANPFTANQASNPFRK